MKLHRLWLGPRGMPTKFKNYGDEWRRLNPELEVIDWSWNNLPEHCINEDVMEDLRRRCTSGTSVELPTAQADVLAYEMVYVHGGIVVNADIQPVRPLDSLLATVGDSPWATYEDETYVVNAAFGGLKGDPFWEAVIEELPRRYFRLQNEGNGFMNWQTGPRLLTDVHNARPGELKVLPVEVFNPVHYTQIAIGGDASGLWTLESLPPNTVGVHHWAHRESGRTNLVS